jgi:hypothetical protein
MPYDVQSHCPACGVDDTFVIGLWPDHLGVFACRRCQKLVNIPLATEKCPGCGCQPSVEEFYDYAYAVPYFSGPPPEEREAGPECPKCGQGRLVFQTTSHFNVGRLGTPKDGKRPWIGKDYLEKAIFVYALMAVCSEFDLQPQEILDYYNLDVPGALLVRRRISIPIVMDIRAHLLAVAACGEAPFDVTPKMLGVVSGQFGDMLQAIAPKKRWWQFWK